jgi:hypothetical protein
MKRLLFHAYVMPLVIASFAGGLSGCASTHVAEPASATLPAELRIGPEQTLDQVLVTRGDETWRCERDSGDARVIAAGTQSALRWAQVGSAGTLVDQARQNVGNVLPGGYFVAYDGSFVRAQMARQSQVNANTLTWVLYSVPHDAGTRFDPRRFARISSIERIATAGGLPPDPRCSHEGLRLLVPYSATYLLYRTTASVPPASGQKTASTQKLAQPAQSAGHQSQSFVAR